MSEDMKEMFTKRILQECKELNYVREDCVKISYTNIGLFELQIEYKTSLIHEMYPHYTCLL